MSLGTGSKCVGTNLLPRDGSVIHDSHAEVVSRRALLRLILWSVSHDDDIDFSMLSLSVS